MVDQVNITTNMKGEKPAANGFFHFLIFFFLSFVHFFLTFFFSFQVQRNIFYVINRQTGMKLMLSTESAPEKRKWV